LELGMQEQVSTKRVNNDFGFFIPEVLLKIVCNKINFILEAILLKITSSFTPYYFVATIMYALPRPVLRRPPIPGR
jgi:hypothetical protein